MSADDDITRTLLEGDPYDRATVSVRRLFPISIRRKIQLAILTTAGAVPIAPALSYREELIRTLQGTGTPVETLTLSLASLAFAGVLLAFPAGLFLIRHQYVVRHRTLDEQTAERMVRLEDLYTFVTVQGTLFVLVALVGSTIGVLSSDTVERLYAYGIELYRPSPLAVGAQIVSVSGGISTVLLYAIWLIMRRPIS